MSAAVAHRLFDPAPAPERPRLAVVREGRAGSLDTLLTTAWTTLAHGRAVSCPMCGGHMAPRPTASGDSAGGRCRDCGTSYSAE